MRATRPILCLMAAAIVFTFAARPAEADLWTVSGKDTAGEAVSAQATFTVSNGSIEIKLTNLLGNPTSDGQLISGLSFSVSGATGTASLTSSSGAVSTVNSSNGSYTAGVTQSLTHWGASGSVGLTTLTGGKPNDLIIGPDSKGNFNPALGGLYTNANPSISKHNPVVLGTGTFDIAITGVTSTSLISAVIFDFGTSTDPIGGVHQPAAAPEPSTLAIAGLGALAFIGYGLRKRQKT
jgi:hypothetical protein